MFIGNPKVRSKINTVIDSSCVAVYLLLLPFAIVCGIVAGALKRIF